MSGWMKFDIDRWPEVLDKYERPVPAWVADHDLRWLDNEVRMGRLARLPGRLILMRRWGCTAYVAEAALRTVSRSSAGDQQVVSRSSAGDQQVVSRSSAGRQQVEDITSGDIEQKSAGRQQVVSRSSAGDQQVVSSTPSVVIDSASVLELPKKEEVRKKEEKDNHNKGLSEEGLAVMGGSLLTVCKGLIERDYGTIEGIPSVDLSQSAIMAIKKWRRRYEEADFVAVWNHASKGPNAYYRDGKYLRWETLANDKFPTRVEQAHQWVAEGSPSKAGPNKSDLATAICDQIQQTPHPDDKRFRDVAIQIPHIEMLADGFGGVSFLRSALLDKWKRKETIERVRRMLSNVE